MLPLFKTLAMQPRDGYTVEWQVAAVLPGFGFPPNARPMMRSPSVEIAPTKPSMSEHGGVHLVARARAVTNNRSPALSFLDLPVP
jgi:hypothetical protein